MGLAIVEFIMYVEETFGVELPENEMEEVSTPRDLINLITRIVSRRDPSACATQQAFYRLRREIASRTGVERSRIRPSTAWSELLPGPSLRRTWRGIRAAAVLDIPRPRASHTVGHTARAALERRPAQFAVPAGGWTRAEVAAVVNDLIVRVLQVENFTEDSSFLGDLRVD